MLKLSASDEGILQRDALSEPVIQALYRAYKRYCVYWLYGYLVVVFFGITNFILRIGMPFWFLLTLFIGLGLFSFALLTCFDAKYKAFTQFGRFSKYVKEHYPQEWETIGYFHMKGKNSFVTAKFFLSDSPVLQDKVVRGLLKFRRFCSLTGVMFYLLSFSTLAIFYFLMQ